MGELGTLSPAWRWTTNAISLLSVFFFSGIIFGWAPLELMLLEEGQYEELCYQDGANESFSSSTCADRMNRLNAIFTLAQFFLSFASLPIGFLLDIAPKPFHFAIAGILEMTGLVLFSISDSDSDRDYFLLGYSLLAVGGCMTMLGAFPASFLLAKYQAGILASIACLFDGSSIIFFAFHKLHHNYGYTKEQIFMGWACMAAVVYAALVICWTHLEQNDWRNVLEQEEEDEITSTAGNEESEELINNKGDDIEKEHKDPYLHRIHKSGLHSKGVMEQLRTWEYALAVMFASCQMVRCNFFIMTVDDYLKSIGDDDDTYANLFSWILPCGIIFVPVIERTVTSWGVLRSLHFTNGIGLVFGLLLWVPSLRVQLLNFGIFTCFRAYLYAVLNSFIALTFGVSTMGRIVGFVFTTGAVVTLVQYPLSVWTNVDQNGNFFPANVVMVLLCSLTIFAIFWYERLSNGEYEKDAAAADASPLYEANKTYGSANSFRERRTSLLDNNASTALASPGSSLRAIRLERLLQARQDD